MCALIRSQASLNGPKSIGVYLNSVQTILEESHAMYATDPRKANTMMALLVECLRGMDDPVVDVNSMLPPHPPDDDVAIMAAIVPDYDPQEVESSLDTVLREDAFPDEHALSRAVRAVKTFSLSILVRKNRETVRSSETQSPGHLAALRTSVSTWLNSAFSKARSLVPEHDWAADARAARDQFSIALEQVQNKTTICADTVGGAAHDLIHVSAGLGDEAVHIAKLTAHHGEVYARLLAEQTKIAAGASAARARDVIIASADALDRGTETVMEAATTAAEAAVAAAQRSGHIAKEAALWAEPHALRTKQVALYTCQTLSIEVAALSKSMAELVQKFGPLLAEAVISMTAAAVRTAMACAELMFEYSVRIASYTVRLVKLLMQCGVEVAGEVFSAAYAGMLELGSMLSVLISDAVRVITTAAIEHGPAAAKLAMDAGRTLLSVSCASASWVLSGMGRFMAMQIAATPARYNALVEQNQRMLKTYKETVHPVVSRVARQGADAVAEVAGHMARATEGLGKSALTAAEAGIAGIANVVSEGWSASDAISSSGYADFMSVDPISVIQRAYDMTPVTAKRLVGTFTSAAYKGESLDARRLQGVNDLFFCPICFNPYEQPLLLRCGHSLCAKCLNSHVDVHKEGPAPCPQCRAPIVDPAYENTALRSIVGTLEGSKPTEGLTAANATFLGAINAKIASKAGANEVPQEEEERRGPSPTEEVMNLMYEGTVASYAQAARMIRQAHVGGDAGELDVDELASFAINHGLPSVLEALLALDEDRALAHPVVDLVLGCTIFASSVRESWNMAYLRGEGAAPPSSEAPTEERAIYVANRVQQYLDCLTMLIRSEYSVEDERLIEYGSRRYFETPLAVCAVLALSAAGIKRDYGVELAGPVVEILVAHGASRRRVFSDGVTVEERVRETMAELLPANSDVEPQVSKFFNMVRVLEAKAHRASAAKTPGATYTSRLMRRFAAVPPPFYGVQPQTSM